MEIKQNKQKHPLRKVSQEMINVILKDIKDGSPIKYAAEANGISARHFHYMVKQGIDDIEHDEKDTIYAKLVRSLRKIEQQEIKDCKEKIKKEKKGHRGAEWILEHAYWRDFSSNAPAIEMDERISRLEQGEDNEDDSK